MIRALLVLLALTGPALAQVATVTSGEHPGFTRLLVAATGVEGWRLTRTVDGYALDAGSGVTGFDLSRAFERIPRTRVTALFADPADGQLRIRVGCACNAIAFQYEGRYLVVDVRDGPPRARSAFELTQGGARLPPLGLANAVVAAAPAGAGYDWLAARRVAGAAEAVPRSAPPTRGAGADVGTLRQALLAGIARGAAVGVVGMALPDGGQVAAPAGVSLFDGGAEGIAVLPGTGRDAERRVAAADCPSPEAFDIGSWASNDPYLAQLGQRRSALLAEFDRPDPEAVARAVRLYLYMGFGAEATDLLRAYPEAAMDTSVAEVMAAVLDDREVEARAVAAWPSCAGAAPLWAALALPPDNAAAADRDIVRQAFGTLPPHLRSRLAPRLAVLADLAGDPALRASIEAAAGRRERPPSTAGGNAASLLAAWRDGGSDAVPAALAYVAAAERAGLRVPDEVPGALLSLADERRGLPEAADLSRAGRIAAALAQDMETAFADPEMTARLPDIWAILTATADDDTFIAMTVAHRAAFPSAQADLSARIARRLLDLRLPDQALAWVPPDSTDPAAAILAAEALVALGRGAEALERLDGTPPDAATAALRARAADLAGAYDLAAAAWTAAGDPERAGRSARLAGNPAAARDDDPWRRLAADVAGAPRPLATEAVGPLQTGNALVGASARLRADIDALLSDTTLPVDR